jgi:hypothetical protein
MKQTLVDRTSEQAGGGDHLSIAIQRRRPKLFDLPGQSSLEEFMCSLR